MKALRSKTPLHLFLVLVVAVLTISGCGGASQAPTIPPVETFDIPFEDFENSGTGGLVSFQTGNQSNWNYAALAVGIWSTIIRVGLAVPVAAFQASFHNIPLQQDDGSLVWSYSVNIGGSIYTAELHA